MNFEHMLSLNGLGDIIVRTMVVYLFLLVGLRLSGKREMGQMTIFDLVVILVLSNAVQNAMVGDNTSLSGGLVAATTLLVINYAVSIGRQRSKKLARFIGGAPTLLVYKGGFIRGHLAREHMSEDEVLMAMREHGIDHLSEVRSAILETDGSISVVPEASSSAKPKRHVRFLKKGI
jgi:uncharacterized membrane protein YcaP (DUF421 family)